MSTLEFLKELTQEWEEDDLIEIRCTPVKQKVSYVLLESFAKSRNVYLNQKKSLFFRMNQLALIEEFLQYSDNHFAVYEKVCYSVNPRQLDKNRKIEVSGLDRTNKLYTLVLDVEEITKEDEIVEDKQKRLDEYILHLEQKIAHKLGLTYPIKINSGRGRHLLYRIEKVMLTKAKREWLKEVLEELFSEVKTSEFHIDEAVKDVSRVLGLPGSQNLKWNRQVFVEQLGSAVKPFKVKSKRKKKRIENTNSLKFEGQFYDSLEWHAFTSSPEEGEIQVKIVFALKLLLKDKFPNLDHREVEQKAKEIWGEQWFLNPQQGTDDKSWHPNLILNYCEKHKSWMKKHPNVQKRYEKYKKQYSK